MKERTLISCSGIDLFLLGAQQVPLGVLVGVDDVEELAVEVDEDVDTVDNLYHVAIPIKHHVKNGECAERQSEHHEDHTSDHAWNHAVARCILKEGTD